jgi:hypothetical protein
MFDAITLSTGDIDFLKRTLRKTRRDAISDKTKRIVYDFWLSPGISHPTGHKSDIKRERLGPNIYALNTYGASS